MTLYFFSEFAEAMQVANYGIGGHFTPHLDVLHETRHDPLHNRRIATWLGYLSNVKAGGGTAFLELNIVAEPDEGSAIFWYNLKENGDLEERVKHAACPIIEGNKWISNKWFHEFGQEFKRPCPAE